MTTKLQKMLKDNSLQKELESILEEFKIAYCIEQGVRVEDLELCCHEESDGRRAVMYFRKKGNKEDAPQDKRF